MDKTKIYLNYLAKIEAEKMTLTMPFLYQGGEVGKKKLTEIAAKLYGEGKVLELARDNGNSAWGSVSNFWESKYFYTIIQFEKKNMTEQALSALGTTESTNFPYYYAISLCKEDRRLYLVSFQDECSPNWNGRYNTQRYIELEKADFPILQEGCFIYRMDDALHGAINDSLTYLHSQFVEQKGCVSMTVRDQHGNYTDIVGESIDAVFRDYADNYTGYRNYRRQMASEWEIMDEKARARYETWKVSAKGLKSDFDKFYGSGIVD